MFLGSYWLVNYLLVVFVPVYVISGQLIRILLLSMVDDIISFLVSHWLLNYLLVVLIPVDVIGGQFPGVERHAAQLTPSHSVGE